MTDLRTKLGTAFYAAPRSRSAASARCGGRTARRSRSAPSARRGGRAAPSARRGGRTAPRSRSAPSARRSGRAAPRSRSAPSAGRCGRAITRAARVFGRRWIMSYRTWAARRTAATNLGSCLNGAHRCAM